MAAVLSIGEVSPLPFKRIGVILNPKKNEFLTQKTYAYLEKYFAFYYSWESARKDQTIYKNLVLTIETLPKDIPNLGNYTPLVLPIVRIQNFSSIRQEIESLKFKVTPILTDDIYLTLEDLKDAFLKPGLINLTVDELMNLGNSDYIFTFRIEIESNFLNVEEDVHSILKTPFEEFFMNHQLSNFEFKIDTLVVYIVEREDLNIEEMDKIFSLCTLSLNSLNNLIRFDKEKLKEYFGVSAGNDKKRKILIFIGLKNISQKH